MFGAVGGISGITTALLLARGESGRQINEVATWRVTPWGFLGGFAPAALFTLLALMFGAAASAVVPLLVLGLISGGIDGTISGSASAAAKRVELPEPDDQPKLPATSKRSPQSQLP